MVVLTDEEVFLRVTGNRRCWCSYHQKKERRTYSASYALFEEEKWIQEERKHNTQYTLMVSEKQVSIQTLHSSIFLMHT